MNAIMQHEDAMRVRQITEPGRIAVEPRKLSIQREGMNVLWTDSADIEVAMRAANQRHGAVVPQNAEAGYVIVALAIDGEETLNEVVTSDEGTDLTAKLGLIDSAVELLEVTRAGILAASGARAAVAS